MRWRNEQRAPAHRIRRIAVHLEPIARIIRDLPAVLQILGVTKQHNALDLVAHARRQFADRVAHHCRALAVPASDDRCIRALGAGQVEQALGFVDGRAGGACGEEVVG